MPELIIIAGANGVGKTTFARPFTEEKGYDFLNADDIAQELAEKGETSPLIKAGKIFFNRLAQFLDNQQSIVVETTLSGSYINKVATRAKEIGYQIKVIYIFLDSPEMCIARVKSRKYKGGHDVPPEDVERRYYRSIGNFWNNFTIISEWVLTYNGEFGFQQTAIGSPENISVQNEVLFSLFNSILEKYESGQ